MDIEKLQDVRNKTLIFVKSKIGILLEISIIGFVLKWVLDKAGFEYMFISFAIMLLIRLRRL